MIVTECCSLLVKKSGKCDLFRSLKLKSLPCLGVGVRKVYPDQRHVPYTPQIGTDRSTSWAQDLNTTNLPVIPAKNTVILTTGSGICTNKTFTYVPQQVHRITTGL